MPNKGEKKCACCGTFYPESQMYGQDEDGKPVCERCVSDDEMEPAATVYYSDGGPMGHESDCPHTVGHYHNNTEGDFTVEWHATDGWRGYYAVKSETYEQVVDDCILSWSADEKMLKTFDDLLKKMCDEHNIRYARVFARTSNLFSCGYDFFVLKEDMEKYEKVKEAVDKLKVMYRDKNRFRMTALTGKDEFDANDRLLMQAAERLFAGEDPDCVMKDVVKQAGQLQEMM